MSAKNNKTEKSGTILNYFSPLNSEINASKSSTKLLEETNIVKKISCPGCSELVSEARIGFHIDHECSSRLSLLKTKKAKKRSGQNRISSDKHKILNNACKTADMGSEELSVKIKYENCESKCTEDVLFEWPESANHFDPNSGVFVSPSMIKTELQELGDNVKATDVKTSSIESGISAVQEIENMLKTDWGDDDDSSTFQTIKRRKSFQLYPSNPPSKENCSAGNLVRSCDACKQSVRFSVHTCHRRSKESLLENINEESDAYECKDKEIGKSLRSQCTSDEALSNTTDKELTNLAKCSVKLANLCDSNSSELEKTRKSANMNSSCDNCLDNEPSRHESENSGNFQFQISNQSSSYLNFDLSQDSDIFVAFGVENSPRIVTPERTPAPSPVKSSCFIDSDRAESEKDSSKEFLSSFSTSVPEHSNALSITKESKQNFILKSSKFVSSDEILQSVRNKSTRLSPAVKRQLVSFGLNNVRSYSSEKNKNDVLFNSTSVCRNLLSEYVQESFQCNDSIFSSQDNPPIKSSALLHTDACLSDDINVLNCKFPLIQEGISASFRSNSVTPIKTVMSSPIIDSAMEPVKISLRSPKNVRSTNLCTPVKSPHDKSPKSTCKRSSSKSSESNLNTPSKLTDVSVLSDSTEISVDAKRSKNSPEKFRSVNGYYLDNFLTVIEAVCQSPNDFKLFNDDEKNIIETFHGFSLQAKKLYVRFFQRTVEWKRLSKVNYPDICDKEDIILYLKELSYANYVHLETDLTELEEGLQLLNLEEVQCLCRENKIQVKNRSKMEQIQSLVNNCKRQPTIFAAFGGQDTGTKLLLEKVKKLLGHACLLDQRTRKIFLRLVTLYSLPRYDEDDNGQQHQLVTLLRVNSGQVKYPTGVVLTRTSDIFRCREDLLKFEECQEAYSGVRDAIDVQDWALALQLCDQTDPLRDELLRDTHLRGHDSALPQFIRRYTSLSLLHHLCNFKVEALQRLRRYEEAVVVLRQLLSQQNYLLDHRGAWYERLALNLDQHLKRREEVNSYTTLLLPRTSFADRVENLLANLNGFKSVHSLVGRSAEALLVVCEAMLDPEVRVGRRLAISIRGQRLAMWWQKRFFEEDVDSGNNIEFRRDDNDDHRQLKSKCSKQGRRKTVPILNDGKFCVEESKNFKDVSCGVGDMEMLRRKIGKLLPEVQFMTPAEPTKVIIEGRCFQVSHRGPGEFRRLFVTEDSSLHSGDGPVTVCSVEELVISYYRQRGYIEGIHAEGAVSNSIFGLLFWNVLYYYQVPDAFRVPHQAVPLDIDDSLFYQSRKDVFDEKLLRLSAMTEDELQEEVEDVWTQHHEECSIVHWDLFKSSQHAVGLILSLGLPVVAAICRRLAQDHRFTRSGFPDIVVWDPNARISRIVEVKGPNDRLSTKQILWLEYLEGHGACAEVCYVEAVGMKKMFTNNKKSPTIDSPKKAEKRKGDERDTGRRKGKRSRTGAALCENDNDDEDFVSSKYKRK